MLRGQSGSVAQSNLIAHLTAILNISTADRNRKNPAVEEKHKGYQSNFQPKRLFTSYKGKLGPQAQQFIQDMGIELGKRDSEPDRIIPAKIQFPSNNLQKFVGNICHQYDQLYTDLTNDPNWKNFLTAASANLDNTELVTDTNISGAYFFKILSRISQANPDQKHLNKFLQEIHSAYTPEVPIENTMLNLEKSILKKVVKTNVNNKLGRITSIFESKDGSEKYKNLPQELNDFIIFIKESTNALSIDNLFKADIDGIHPELQAYYKAILTQADTAHSNDLNEVLKKVIKLAMKNLLERKPNFMLKLLHNLSDEQMSILAGLFAVEPSEKTFGNAADKTITMQTLISAIMIVRNAVLPLKNLESQFKTIIKTDNPVVSTFRNSLRKSKMFENIFAEPSLPSQQELEQNFQQFIAACNAAELLRNSANKQTLIPEELDSSLTKITGSIKIYTKSLDEQLRQLEEQIKSINSQITTLKLTETQRESNLTDLCILQRKIEALAQQLPSAQTFQKLTEAVDLKDEKQLMLPARLDTIQKMVNSFIELLQPPKITNEKNSVTLNTIGKHRLAKQTKTKSIIWKSAKPPLATSGQKADTPWQSAAPTKPSTFRKT